MRYASVRRYHSTRHQKTAPMIVRYAIMLAAALLFHSASLATPTATTPIAPQHADRWRIGYVESGDYVEYPLTLGEIIDGLEILGWLQLDAPRPQDLSGEALWQWLARNVRSEWLELVADAYWRPGNFDAEQRAPMREALTERLH